MTTFFGHTITTTAALGAAGMNSEQIAERATTLLHQLTRPLSPGRWLVLPNLVWEGTAAELMVAMSGQPALAPPSAQHAPFGQLLGVRANFTLNCPGPEGPIGVPYTLQVTILAGAPLLGRHHPLNRVSVTARPLHPDPGPVPTSLPDTLVALSHTLIETLVDDCDPLMAYTLTPRFPAPAPALAGSGWPLPTGLQLWLPESMPVQTNGVPVLTQPMGPGTLLTNPLLGPNPDDGTGLRAVLHASGHESFPPPSE